MAHFKKRIDKSGNYSVQAFVKRKGFKHQYATFTGKAPMATARAWAAKVEAEMREGKYKISTPADRHTADEMMQRYIDNVLPTKSRKQRYLKLQHAQLLWWKQKIGSFTLSNISQSLLAACRDELARTRSAATVNRYLAAISHVFTIAVKEWEWLEASPIARVRKPKENRGRVRFLSDNEREALLEACKQECRKPLYLLVVLAISTGARKNEILSLKWQNVDLERCIIILEDTKNSESRPLFLAGLALEEFRKHPHHHKSEYVFPARCGTAQVDIDREFRRAVKRAGINDFHFHDLRHTTASYLAMNGATHSDIAEVLGHKSLNMVKRYAHLSKTHTASVVAAMNEKIFGNNSAEEDKSCSH